MSAELVIVLVMGFGLTAYAVLGGADFGGGVWEFNTALRSTDEERDLIYKAVGPVWETNHVWLIFILIGLFGGFPTAFAAISRALWLPLLLAVTGIVLRGVGFAFRSYAAGAARQQQLWGAAFALASTGAPFFLGAAGAAIASGKLEVTADGGFTGSTITGWISLTSIYGAFLSVGACAYLAAVFLTREAAHSDNPTHLEPLWRKRALATGVWLGILAGGGLIVISQDAPAFWNSFGLISWLLVAVSAVAGVVSLWALTQKRYALAPLTAALAVAAVIWGWLVAQYPLLVPPAISIESAKGPSMVMRTMVISIGLGALLLLPSLAYLFYLFKGHRPEGAVQK